MPDTVKPEQWPVQSQPTHRKYKRDETGDLYTADMKQYQYPVSKQVRKKITRKQITGTMICSKSAGNVLGLSKQNNTKGTCAGDVNK